MVGSLVPLSMVVPSPMAVDLPLVPSSVTVPAADPAQDPNLFHGRSDPLPPTSVIPILAGSNPLPAALSSPLPKSRLPVSTRKGHPVGNLGIGHLNVRSIVTIDDGWASVGMWDPLPGPGPHSKEEGLVEDPWRSCYSCLVTPGGLSSCQVRMKGDCCTCCDTKQLVCDALGCDTSIGVCWEGDFHQAAYLELLAWWHTHNGPAEWQPHPEATLWQIRKHMGHLSMTL